MTSTQTERLSTGNPEKKSLRCLKTTVGKGKLYIAEQVDSSSSNSRAGFYMLLLLLTRTRGIMFLKLYLTRVYRINTARVSALKTQHTTSTCGCWLCI